ncbi:MAG: BatD family protein [Bacteroidales bacterium]|jgi:tetratricopeptide (TPR) repeat protein|nr:BatD family protein [Bacteroidales bacterium]MCI2121585.1 BatD family protein [Bacteroidales bacterium]MCI2145697.1 BatD family protein [Bacteroidales bacterium]
MKRFFYIAVLLFVTSFTVYAQHNFTVEAPNVVSADETFRVVFTADGKISDFDWPGSSDFDVVWGPQSGSSSSVSIINGKRTSSFSETYTYVLQPKKEGKFTIPAATCKLGKKTYASGSVTVEVVKAQGNAASQSPSQGSGGGSNDYTASESVPAVSGKDCFIRMLLSKTSVVKGEPIVATIKIYTKSDISGFDDVKFPDYNGFWSQELQSPQKIEFHRENVNGSIYNVALLRSNLLIAQQTGTLTINPAEVGVVLRVRGESSGNSIFDDFFDNYNTVHKKLTTPAVSVKVRPLPSGAPASFKGGVGQYKMSVRLSRDSIKSNEAASLIIKITGEGNIALLDAPEINLPADFEVYDTKATNNVTNGTKGMSGTRTFEVPFIPRSRGSYKIDPISYSYYDNSKGRYETLSSDTIYVNVSKGSDVAGGGVAVQGVNRKDVKTLSDDIRFITTGDPHLRKIGSSFVGSLLFYLIAGLILLVAVAAGLLLKSVSARRMDIAGTRNRKASKMARKRLRQAENFMKQDLYSAFYEELHKAVLGYVSDKLTIPMAGLSKENIAERLLERSVTEDTVKSFSDIIDACEYARYAPDSTHKEMENIYGQAVKAVSDIESEIRSPKQPGKTSANAAIVITLLVALASPVFKAKADPVVDTLWSQANRAYTEGSYDTALPKYKAIVEQDGLASPELYCNIGDCYFKMSQISDAILYYEKALKLDPSFADAENNLAICQARIVDRIDVLPEFFLTKWTRKLKYSMSSNAWAWISLILLSVTAILLLVYFYGRSGRVAALVFSCIFFALTLCSAGLSFSEKRDAAVQNTAIVMQPAATVKSSPGDSGNDVFVIHEGIKVNVLDTLGDWTKIEISDGRQGWLPESYITKI